MQRLDSRRTLLSTVVDLKQKAIQPSAYLQHDSVGVIIQMNQWMPGKRAIALRLLRTTTTATSAMSKYNVLVGGRGIHIYYELSERTREREGSTVNVCSIVV